jgi:PEP-CTERM motif
MGSTLLRLEPEPHWPPGCFREEFLFARDYREHHGDQLPDTPFWHYLERRESIDPARFIHWHPIVGRWIADQPHGHTIAPPPSTEPQQIGPAPAGVGSVPEPASWVLLAMGAISVAIRKARGK